MMLPTMNELAKMFGVARITVHKAMKDLIRDKYLISRKGVGTFVNPAKVRSYPGEACIGILVGDAKQSFCDRYFWSQISAVAEATTRHRGFAKLISLSSSSPAEMLTEAKNNIIDGIIWIAPDESGADALRAMQAASFPAVSFNMNVEGVNSVAGDVEAMAYETGLALLEEGRRNIVFTSHLEEVPVTGMHLDGLKNAFKSKAVEFNESLVFKNKTSIQADLERLFELGVDVHAMVVPWARHLHEVMEVVRKMRIDLKDRCRLLADATFADEEPDFQGWVYEFRFKEAAENASAMLTRMIDKHDFSVEAGTLELDVKRISKSA
jgi:DNA-binding LacI/PurR family transcriptional regulator